IGANENSFDIYLPGGGSGAFPEFCAEFWVGSDANVKWGEHILDSSCDTYFNHFNFTSGYNVTYANKNHNAVDTLKSACEFAYTTSGFSLSNFNNVKIIPVACPSTLTQVTGLRLTDDVKKVGNQSIQTLGALTDADFDKTALVASTTQMQDCKSPSSSYDNKVNNAVENYQASISAELTHPVLMEEVPSIVNYCTKNPSVTAFCSCNQGELISCVAKQ
ncbi:MAG: hypothetical protein EBY16_08685, partial [Gammaproteobacteria bacterium]|nr:hypothetical protein [Gammaproteobacteria bacterium]